MLLLRRERRETSRLPFGHFRLEVLVACPRGEAEKKAVGYIGPELGRWVRWVGPGSWKCEWHQSAAGAKAMGLDETTWELERRAQHRGLGHTVGSLGGEEARKEGGKDCVVTWKSRGDCPG